MACIRWRSDVFGCGRVCLIQWCLLLTDSVGSQTARLSAWLSAHCHLMEIPEDCGSQIHNYCYILLFFLASGIFTFYRGISSWLIGNCNRHQLFWEQRYKAPSSQNTFQSVSQSLLIVLLKRKMVNGKLVYDEITSDWFTMTQTFKNTQC